MSISPLTTHGKNGKISISDFFYTLDITKTTIFCMSISKTVKELFSKNNHND